MSERLSEEERGAPTEASADVTQQALELQVERLLAVIADLRARLADQAARLAAVEALVRKFHIAGDLTDAQVNDFLAALHPDSSESKP